MWDPIAQLCARCDELSGFKDAGKNFFMLIADRINHFRTCTVTLLAAFLSNNNIHVQFAVVLLGTRKRMCASLPSSVRASRKPSEFCPVRSSKLVLPSLTCHSAEQDACLCKDYGTECG